MNEQKVSALFLTKYTRKGPSSRYRFLQYFPYLEAHGIRCVSSPLTDDPYLEHMFAHGRGSVIDIAKSIGRRIAALASVARYDVAIIEYELLPYFPASLETLVKKAGIPYIVNYDDAIFYRYSEHPNALVRRFLGNKIASVMRHADLVVAGNDYLAGYARKAGAPRVETLPTVVDIDRYPRTERAGGSTFRIGWIGSPSTSKYLNDIAPALAGVCEGGRAKVVLIGASKVELGTTPVEARPWSEETEVADLASCDCGIMPLADGLWERGKCGLKLIQYMASGLPVVVSPVGANKEIVEGGVDGFFAQSNDEWLRALTALRDDPGLRARMGMAGRRKVEARYTLQETAPRLAAFIADVAKK